ncbi:MAG: RimK family protein [Candidatus Omnitrophota bacterium]
MRNIVVVNNPAEWDIGVEGIEVAAAKAYLSQPHFAKMKTARIFNLCRTYRYQTNGYYVSLLAEARGHRAFPSVTTIQDFQSRSIVQVISDEIDELIQKSLLRLKTKDFSLSIYFGKNMAKQYCELSKRLYGLFQAPLLRANFIFNKKWILSNITPIPLNAIPENHKGILVEFARDYFSRKKFHASKLSTSLYDLAILINPEEKIPPSNKRAIKKFIEAAEELDFYIELITREDYSRIPEFDALFIRETTAVNHHTYRFARRAHAEGLVVLDDPLSIVRCSNKVYLAELLTKAKVLQPKTIIVHKHNIGEIEKELGLPCILKQPDSFFSQGVIKVTERNELYRALEQLLKISDLVIAQEFIPTEFDWRIGVLDKKPLFACKYYMAKGHWQIYNWRKAGKSEQDGQTEAMAISRVPECVIDTAVKAANMIGDGLYGVDLKQIGNRAIIVEINDNPSIDAGVEDSFLKEKLYYKVMQSFLRRLRKRND